MSKLGIHPKYFDGKFECTTCGNNFTTGTTKGSEVKVDTCSSCHPFYTGNQNFANAAGRVEKFKTKFAKKEEIKAKVEDHSKSQKIKNESKKTQDK